MKNLNLPKEKVTVSFETGHRPSALVLRRVDEDHGNPLKVWEEMGSPVSLNRAEIEDIKAKTAVLPEAWSYSWEDGKVGFEAELGVNDVYMFTLFD